MQMRYKDVKPILTVEENELEISKRSTEIDCTTENKIVREIVSVLKKTIEKNNITALSAPAIGYDRRIFCIKFNEEIKTFINPIIMHASGMQLSREKCTSIPNKEFIIPRNNDLEIVYQRPTGKIEGRQIVGLAALVFQHEMQHLDGILLSDLGLEIDEQWDSASEQEKAEVLKAFLDSLDLRSSELDKQIQSDPELKQISDAIDFMTSVYTGETELEPIE